MGLILLIVLLVFFCGGLPQMGLHEYGWGPSGGLGLILLVVFVLLLLGRL